MADIRDVNLNRLAIFVAVVEAGSLTAAAERLGLAKTMVSAHVQRLEAEIGASLVVRTTRRLNVTEAGRAFYDACRDILRATETALAAVAGDAGPLRGTLRVSAPVDYGALVVAPALVALRDAHPALEIELQCDDRVVDQREPRGRQRDERAASVRRVRAPRDPPPRLVIGDRNTIREFTTIHTGTVQDTGVTTLGDDNWIMAYVHIGHDCRVGSHVILSSNAQMAGHVEIGDWAIVGGMSGVHQFVRIGAHSMLGGASALVQDIPPFVIAAGNKAEPHGINV